MNNAILIIIVSYFISVPLPSFAQTMEQYYVAGTVIDTASNPIIGAIVSFHTTDDLYLESIITGADGNFRIKGTPGRYKLSIKHLSYNEFSTVIELTDNFVLDTITMTPSFYDMNPVSVFGSRIQYGYDNYTIAMQNNPIAEGKNASEVLSYLPYVSKAGGDLTVLGQGVSRIRINGIVIRDPKELDAIQAKDIDNIEVVLFSRYDQGGSIPGGEINIKLKKTTEGGFYGSLTGYSSAYLKYGLNSSGLNSSFSYGIKKISIYNYLNVSGGKTYLDNDYSMLYKQEDKQRNSVTQTRTTSNLFSDRLSINYDISDNHILGTNFQYSRGKSAPKYSSLSDLMDISSDDSDISRSSSISSGEVLNNQYQASLVYTWTIGERGASFKFTGDYLRYETDTEGNYEYLYNLEQNDQYSTYSKNVISNNVDMYYANAAFRIPIGEKKLFSFGFNYDNNRTWQVLDYQGLSSGSWIKNPDRSDNYKLSGDNYAGFVSFYSKIGSKVDYSLSARYQERRMRYNSIKTTLENNKTFGNMEYAASLSYHFSKRAGDMLTLSYNRWIFDIPYSAITPIITYINEYSYTKGNLDLEPSVADNFIMTLGLKDKTQFLIRLQRVNNGDMHYNTFIDPQNSLITYTMPVNSSSPSYNVRLNIEHRFDITSWWKLYAEGLLEWRKFSQPYTGKDNSWVSFISLANTIEINNNMGGSLNFFLKSKTMYAERTYGPVATLNLLFYNYFIDRKLRLALDCTLYSREKWTVTETDNLWDKHYPRTNNTRVSLSLTYNFIGGKKIKVKPTSSFQDYNEIKDELIKY